jgi:hypothetical protein
LEIQINPILNLLIIGFSLKKGVEHLLLYFNLLARNCDINTSSFTSLEKSGNLPALGTPLYCPTVSPTPLKTIPSKAFSVLIPAGDSLNMTDSLYCQTG